MLEVGKTYRTLGGDTAVVTAKLLNVVERLPEAYIGYVQNPEKGTTAMIWQGDGQWWTANKPEKAHSIRPPHAGQQYWDKIKGSDRNVAKDLARVYGHATSGVAKGALIKGMLDAFPLTLSNYDQAKLLIEFLVENADA